MRAFASLALLACLLSPRYAAAYLTFVEGYVDGDGGVDGLLMAQDVAVSPDGKHVYAVSEGDSAIVHFDRNAMTGALTFVDQIV